jgi:hypothetical protein
MRKNVFSILATMMLFYVISANTSAQVKALRTNDFMESIGISGLKVEKYTTEQMPYVKQRISDLKIRYARNQIQSTKSYIDSQYEFYNEIGIKWILNYRTAGTSPSKGISLLKNDYPTLDMLLAIEGLNEPFTFSTGSASDFVNHQTQVYSLVKNDEQLKHLPVIGISVANMDQYKLLGDMSKICDKGNLHSYPTTNMHPGGGMLEQWITAANNASHAGQQFWASEAGYHDNVSIGGTPSNVMAKYLPRLILNYFKNNRIDKLFYYRFMDEETTSSDKWWGICNNDATASPKLAYTAWKNMNSILNDTDAAFNTGTLNYSLTGNLSGIKHVLLQKGDGTYYLVVWQEVDNWNSTGSEFTYPNRQLTLNIGGTAANVKTYLPSFDSGSWPNEGHGTSSKNNYSNVSEIAIAVPDHIMIIEISGVRGTSVTKVHIEGEQLTFYQNPGNKHFYVSINNGNSLISAEIFDLTGKKVFESNFDNEPTKVHLQLNLKNGIYFANFQCKSQNYSKKIIVLN